MFGKPSRRHRHKLESEGRSAAATVLAISDRGMSVTNGNDSIVANTEVVLKTHLRVEPAGEPAFEVEKRFRYPQLSIPTVGSQLSVRYDPDDHDNVMIEDVPAVVNFGGGQLDIGGLLSTISETRAAHPGDRTAMAGAMQSALGLQGVPTTIVNASPFGPPDTISQIERLSALHASGALTDAEFAAEKAKIL